MEYIQILLFSIQVNSPNKVAVLSDIIILPLQRGAPNNKVQAPERLPVFVYWSSPEEDNDPPSRCSECARSYWEQHNYNPGYYTIYGIIYNCSVVLENVLIRRSSSNDKNRNLPTIF